ncbi:MAG: NUDIX domain-containing protein [Clostridia bacterium]|nr:NUDIX domain-containing protein [Clostridia bacterium]
MKNSLEVVKNFLPTCEQEGKDKDFIMQASKMKLPLLDRDCFCFHFCASACVLNQTHSKVLCCFHNIYQSWTIPGGHSEGVDDLLGTAKRELEEETSLHDYNLLSTTPISLDILSTEGHFRFGNYVPAHTHFVVTYLFEANDKQKIQPQIEENKSVRWIDVKKLKEIAKEAQMKRVYSKIYQKLKDNHIVR